MKDMLSVFGSKTFDTKTMKRMLRKEVFESLQKTINEGMPLDMAIIDEVAEAVKEWALENGATHFTHWFLPLTGVPAEKHDSFLDLAGSDIILKFKGKNLLRGEPDASSFPSGGLRQTCSARGYTIWDPSTPIFLKEDSGRTVVCIPTVFLGYHGEALDRKIPLLRSLNALDIQGKRVLKLFGINDVNKVSSTIGPEQEYFLVDHELYKKREDLVMCGRTLFGNVPTKNQQTEECYFAPISPRVASFFKAINEELWSLGITAKTDHNEVAPSQHETAPIYAASSVGADQNMILMDALRRMALKENMMVLFHEKPYQGVNGSGKHNNWSITTDTGINFTDPTNEPHKNLLFLLTLACIVKGVDENAVYLRLAASVPGNDFRLGANEAPPAIISIYLGDQLEDIVNQIIDHGFADHSIQGHLIDLGIPSIAKVYADNTDRNRTSPFAFTGNKFEFRMVASSACIADCNTALNTIVAKEFKEACDILESASNFEEAAMTFITETLRKHKRVIFNGNGYSDEWVKEAEKRGLPNVKTFCEAVESLVTPNTIKMFNDMHVLSERELKSRAIIMYESYINAKDIEAKTALNMVKQQYLPAIRTYIADLLDQAEKVRISSKGANIKAYTQPSTEAFGLLEEATECARYLENELDNASKYEDTKDKAFFYKDRIAPLIEKLREPIDKLELIVDKAYWPVPSYSDLMFEV